MVEHERVHYRLCNRTERSTLQNITAISNHTSLLIDVHIRYACGPPKKNPHGHPNVNLSFHCRDVTTSEQDRTRWQNDSSPLSPKTS